MAKKRDLFPFQSAIDRLKAIVADSGDRTLLADGPPNPDAELLDLCADALHYLTAAEKAHSARPVFHATVWNDELTRLDNELMAEVYRHNGLARSYLLRAKKMRATTASGIYAKALCVRASRTGAVALATSLSEDLVTNAALRASLWPAEDRRAGHAAA